MMARLAGALILALPTTAIAGIAIFQIKVIEGEGAVHAAGSRRARPVVVQVTDDIGRPVEGAAVTFHLPDEGPTATFAAGIRTDMAVTDAGGRAAVRSMQYNRTPGRFEIRMLVVKGETRAGTITYQYISEGRTAAGGRGWSRRRWAAVALIAAGAAGIAAGTAGGGGQTQAASPAAVSVGAPAITVVKP